MTEDTNPREVIGANNPPGPIPPTLPTEAEYIAFWAVHFAEIIAKALDVRVGMKKVPAIDGAEIAAAATSFVVQAKAVKTLLEKARKEQKMPIDKLGDAAQTFFMGYQNPLKSDIDGLEGRLDVWDRKQRAIETARQQALRDAAAAAAREAELEAERKQMAADLAAELAITPEQREAAAAQLQAVEDAQKVVTLHQKEAAKPVVAAGVRGSIGGVGVQSGKWKFELVDLAKVPLEYLQVNEVLINRTISGDAGLHDIPGLRIFRDEKFSVRA